MTRRILSAVAATTVAATMFAAPAAMAADRTPKPISDAVSGLATQIGNDITKGKPALTSEDIKPIGDALLGTTASNTAALSALVAAGTLTQTQADAIIASKASNLGQMMPLVKARVISKWQAMAIRDAYHTSTALTPLVDRGVITQEQANAVISTLVERTLTQ